MPFDAAEVARQIEQSRLAVRGVTREREEALDLALRIYAATGETEWEQRVQDASARRWIGAPLTPLRALSYTPTGPADYVVAATDSSFVAPDKHRGSFSHLVNVGRVMIRYSDPRAAELDSVPSHFVEPLGEGEEMASGKVLAAKCALLELQELYEWSKQYGAAIALVDGSLMQLVNVLSKEEEVAGLMFEYFQTLGAFKDIGMPVIGYISRPASQMVMRAIRVLACDQQIPCEKRPSFECGCRSLWSLEDLDIFSSLLDEGQRSPVFEPLFSHLEGQNAPAIKELVFAYLGTQYEVVRLEFPMWITESGALDRVTGLLLHQCKLDKGYPRALTLAHQQAVLHNSDRESYFFLLERAGLMRGPTEKAHGKRMIGQAI